MIDQFLHMIFNKMVLIFFAHFAVYRILLPKILSDGRTQAHE